MARNRKMMQENNQIRRSPRHEVEAMFDSISPHYDLLNRVLSVGTDRRWRRRAISLIGRHVAPVRILDVATGTGDLAIAAMKLGPEKITGIDISSEMLAIGRRKVERLGLVDRIELLRGDSLSIDFGDGTFDVAMSAFGVRNFEETVTGLREMHRVLRPGGMVMVLEFSKPSWFPMKQIYGFYFRRILPRIGRSVSGDAGAYSYLPESVITFPDNEAFLELLLKAGFESVSQKRLTGGIASIYYGFRA